MILFTSGTSGRPKGAILTHGSLLAAARNCSDALELGPSDVVLGAAPFSHVLGLATGVLSTLLSGSAIAVVQRFEAETTLALMTETQTTILLGVPTMCIALCQAARSAERCRRFGSPMSGAPRCRSRSPRTSSAPSAARSTRATA